ncbi:unnamed protein product [Thelazia callipaeda]|uniref:Secreted protein n=1 Tax=Thelazia callipaeda TaxID=103827 RepID=A0A0N5DBM8_THECL|nr:unnamed protein product [Thelazia callipaeda]
MAVKLFWRRYRCPVLKIRKLSQTSCISFLVWHIIIISGGLPASKVAPESISRHMKGYAFDPSATVLETSGHEFFSALGRI